MVRDHEDRIRALEQQIAALKPPEQKDADRKK